MKSGKRGAKNKWATRKLEEKKCHDDTENSTKRWRNNTFVCQRKKDPAFKKD